MSYRVRYILCISKVSRRSKSCKRARTQSVVRSPFDNSDDSTCTYDAVKLLITVADSHWTREVSNLIFTLEDVGVADKSVVQGGTQLEYDEATRVSRATCTRILDPSEQDPGHASL